MTINQFKTTRRQGTPLLRLLLKSSARLKKASQWREVAKTLSRLHNDNLKRQADEWLSSWDNLARHDQLPPNSDWMIWLLLGGRGAGKTRAGAEWVRGRVADGARRVGFGRAEL